VIWNEREPWTKKITAMWPAVDSFDVELRLDTPHPRSRSAQHQAHGSRQRSGSQRTSRYRARRENKSSNEEARDSHRVEEASNSGPGP